MKLVQSILTKNPCYTAGKKITVKGLMLHSVGCPQPSAAVFIKNWNTESYDRPASTALSTETTVPFTRRSLGIIVAGTAAVLPTIRILA